jgi:hypothetical protein
MKIAQHGSAGVARRRVVVLVPEGRLIIAQHGSAGVAGLANGDWSPGGTTEPSPHPQT